MHFVKNNTGEIVKEMMHINNIFNASNYICLVKESSDNQEKIIYLFLKLASKKTYELMLKLNKEINKNMAKDYIFRTVSSYLYNV